MYRRQHYVPEWYQKRFITGEARQNELVHLALHPQSVVDDAGRRHRLPQQRRRPTGKCFAEDDLYSLRFGAAVSTAIEQQFFGMIDQRGAQAVDWWGDFEHPSMNEDAISDLVRFMTAQKLRTPKGLDWLTQQLERPQPNDVLEAMVELRTIYQTIWLECVWQIADATESPTKFIVTDHPVTIYNRALGPRHEWCRGANDPDIRLHGSHTIFPLGLERCLILTNLSWALDPYQSAVSVRPNPDFYRPTLFNIFDVQTNRQLSEQEVREINFIMKQRAYRYLAAGSEEWLYPEQFVQKSGWSEFGQGYLLMPDPRPLHEGAATVLEYSSGRTEAYDAFGRRPWDPGYDEPGSGRRRPGNLGRFKEEFADLHGPQRRSRSFLGGRLDEDDDL